MSKSSKRESLAECCRQLSFKGIIRFQFTFTLQSQRCAPGGDAPRDVMAEEQRLREVGAHVEHAAAAAEVPPSAGSAPSCRSSLFLLTCNIFQQTILLKILVQETTMKCRSPEAAA